MSMQPYPNTSPISDAMVRPLIRWVYAWMGVGLLFTTAIAWLTNTVPALVQLQSNRTIVIGAIIAELIVVMVLSWASTRLAPTTAAILFLVYAALNGFTLSLIFLVYDVGAITSAFATTTVLFGVMTVIGFTTSADLTKMGTWLMMGVIGLIIAMIVNFFLRSSAVEYIISIIGVVIFTGLTAYDTQKIKRLAASPEFATETPALMKFSIYGALTLYLDFINLFLFLLRLMGRRR